MVPGGAYCTSSHASPSRTSSRGCALADSRRFSRRCRGKHTLLPLGSCTLASPFLRLRRKRLERAKLRTGLQCQRCRLRILAECDLRPADQPAILSAPSYKTTLVGGPHLSRTTPDAGPFRGGYLNSATPNSLQTGRTRSLSARLHSRSSLEC